MSDEEWLLLRTFESEGEARVVESFLLARGFEVELLGTFGVYHAIPGKMAGSGLRLMVRPRHHAAATQALAESQEE